MRVGLYFGSFNPIHHGHLIMASHVHHRFSLDQVWFVVSPQNPFKVNHTLLNEYHRLHLVNLAIEGDSRFRASDIEFKLSRPSYTVDTLTYLEEKYPRFTFSIIIGSDSLQNLDKWKNYGVLLERYEILVYERPGTAIRTDLPGTIRHCEGPLVEISATEIRKMVQEGRPIRYFVPDSVLEHIEESGYYR